MPRPSRYYYLAQLLLTAGMLKGCGQGVSIPPVPRLQLTSDSGYITKNVALSFLLAANLTDATGDYWKERYPRNTDTVGKYYRTDSGGVMVLLEAWSGKDASELLFAIELRKDGTMARTETYTTFSGHWCQESPVRTFSKAGPYFMITGCGHGSGYSSEYRYIFRHPLPEDKLDAIYFGSYSSLNTNDPEFAQLVNSEMSIAGDSIVLRYHVHRGEKGDTMTWDSGTTRTVAYTWDKDHWETGDSALLTDLNTE